MMIHMAIAVYSHSAVDGRMSWYVSMNFAQSSQMMLHSPVQRSMMPKDSVPAKINCMTSRDADVSLSFICSQEDLNRSLVERLTCSRSACATLVICWVKNSISLRVALTCFSQS